MFKNAGETCPAVGAALVKKFIQSWFINTLAVLVAVYLVSGIRYRQPLDLFVASLVLGILNAVIRPFLMFLTLPLLIFSLGLFTLIINAVLLYFWVTSCVLISMSRAFGRHFGA